VNESRSLVGGKNEVVVGEGAVASFIASHALANRAKIAVSRCHMTSNCEMRKSKEGFVYFQCLGSAIEKYCRFTKPRWVLLKRSKCLERNDIMKLYGKSEGINARPCEQLGGYSCRFQTSELL
jgi:hypothetical protein